MNKVRPFIPLKEAATTLHAPYQSAVGLANSGELKSSRIGKKRIVFLDDLDEYIQKINNYETKTSDEALA